MTEKLLTGTLSLNTNKNYSLLMLVFPRGLYWGHDLELISAWAKKWLVDFNPIKTVAMLLTLRPADYLPSLNFNNTVINFIESHKHLGITLTYNGQWHTHIETILNSAYKMLGIMRKLKYRFSRQALNQIYVSYIRPLLE